MVITPSSSDDSSEPVDARFSDDTGLYHAELSPGSWIIDHALSDSKQVWDEFEISSDMSKQFNFVTSVEISGIVYYEENTSAIFNPDDGKNNWSRYNNQIDWEGFSTSSMTNESGQFTVTLPEGAVVDATLEGLVAGLVNGTKFTVSSDMEEIVMVATPGTNVFGLGEITRANNFYTDDLQGEQLTVSAQNDDYDVTWRKSVHSEESSR